MEIYADTLEDIITTNVYGDENAWNDSLQEYIDLGYDTSLILVYNYTSDDFIDGLSYEHYVDISDIAIDGEDIRFIITTDWEYWMENLYSFEYYQYTDIPNLANDSGVDYIELGSLILYDGVLYVGEEKPSTWTIGNKTVSSLFISNKEVQSIVRTSDNVVLYSKSSASPVLITSTITLSANDITYGNSVILTGTLNSERESGYFVKIYKNDTLIDTVSTTTNGLFTRTFSGLNVGTYTFKAVFDGDDTYSSVTSSDVIVTVSKATPTITLSTTNNNLTVGDTLSLNGTFSLGTGKSIKIYQNNTLIDTVTTTTNGAFTKSVTGLASGSYTFKAIYEGNSNYNSVTSSDVIVTVTGQTLNSISLSTNKSILSFYNPNVFSDWIGSYTTGVDTYNYITPSSDNLTINKTLPSEFIFKYKFYTNGNTNSGCLWTIGTDANNGVLVGHELTSKRMKIYTRTNGSNTSRYTVDNAYNFNTWTDVTITYQNQTISISMNGYTQSYALAEASYLKIYYNYNALRLADLEIIDLSNNNVISSTSNNNAILTATVTDENNDVCSNQSVVFTSDTTVLGTATTNNNGVATLNYNSQGVGDIFITANINNLYSNGILIEDCQYYNDGSTINGLDVKSGVSCSSDGEWITITTSTSGEKYVYPPVCYTGSDNWEASFKCNTSNFNSQAFGLQMENCGTTTYSGDSQYTAYTGSQMGNCMGAGNKTYSLSNNDKVSFRRVNGYWRLYVNNTTEIFNRQYNWTNSRVPGFYTNSGRVQRLKELKYKWLRSYNLTINAPTKVLANVEQSITGTLTDNKDNPIINQNVNLVIDGVVVDTQKTNNEGIVTFEYTPLSEAIITVKLTYTGNYDCESLSHNLIITDDKLNLSSNKNTISYKHDETCILTAVYDDGTGATVNLYNNDTNTLLGTMNDNGDGTYSYTYNSQGIGDITFRAECGTSISLYTVEDCFYWNDGTINDIVGASGTSVSVENGALKVTTSSSGEKKFYFPTKSKFSSSANVQMIYECARETGDDSSNGNIIGISFNPSATSATQGYCSYWTSSNATGGSWTIALSGSSTVNKALVKGDIIRLVRENGYSKLYQNNELIGNVSRSISDYYFGGYTNQNRVQRFKNIKIKSL